MCECVFCHKEKIITDFIYEDGLVMAFMDMEPINEGIYYWCRNSTIWMQMKFRMNCWHI